MKTLINLLISIAFICTLSNNAESQITKTVGNTGADFSTLKQAFDAINANSGSVYTGAITLQIIANTTETAAAAITTANTNWTSVNIYPTNSGLSISGNLATPLIDLDGADNVIIDGRVNASGSAKDMVIVNTSNSSTAVTSTIRFNNTAEYNIISYCTIKGSSMSTTSGIIYFATASVGAGNSNNEIKNCNLTNNAGSRPINVIYSSGSSSYTNTTNRISGNNIYDFFNAGASSNGISLSSNSTEFTITANSFYETSNPFSATAANTYRIISINNTSGNNFNISNNYLGGQSASCGGSAFTVTGDYAHLFQAIYLRVGKTTASSIQNNVIKNISYNTTSANPWAGIYIALGAVNIGTITGNNIGETTGDGSITLSNTTANANSYGIIIYSYGTIDIQNNNIGSLTTIGSSSTYHNIVGIYKMLVSGTWTVSNNTIGSTSTTNSIQAISIAATASKGQMVIGIRSYCSGTSIFSNNTISGLYNAYSGGLTSSRTRGIETARGGNTIQNNTIKNISSASGQQFYNVSASVIGISQLSNTSGTTQLIEGNTIYNLSNTHTTRKVDVYGIYSSASTTGTNTILNNFIYGLYLSTSFKDSKIEGILIYRGVTVVYNNIINFGEGTTTGNLFYGIYDHCDAGNNCTIYFNTVYIGGDIFGSTETSSTYALYSNANTSTRDYRNNVLFNDRTGGTIGKHYAIYLAGSTSLTNDYNNYYVSDTGILGKIGSTNYTALDASWKTASGGDGNSVNINPIFMIGGSATPVDYMPATTLAGLPGLGISLDIQGVNRAATPTMGAVERGPFWLGSTSTDFNTASNWSNNIVPSSGTNLFFADDPDRSCYLDMNRTIGAIVINQSTDKLVVNGHDLTIKGTLALSNGGQIDAATSSSTVILESSLSQNIQDGAFYNNEVFNLTINNSNNIPLFGSLHLLNTLTANTGRLDVTTNSSTFVYAGTSAQTIESNLFLNEEFYNLTIDNSTGVTLNTDLAVDNNLLINSGKLFTLSASKNLSVTGTITNSAGNSGFILNSDATGTASLIHNTNNVPATVERYVSGSAEDWHFLSAPVAGQEISPAIPTTPSWVPSGTYGNGTGYDMYLWDEPTNCWIYKLNDDWNTLNPGADFVVGRGYLYSVQAENPTKEFAGNLNNGSISYGLTIDGSADATLQGFNLVGNPYPSSIDWMASSGWTRSNLAASSSGNDMWIWNPAKGNYGVCNSATGDGTNSVTRYIASMQGFFVRAQSEGTMGTTNNVRVHGATIRWKSAQIIPNRITAVVYSENDNTSDEVRLLFGYPENNAGAPKLFSPLVIAPSLYLPEGNTNFSIRYLSDTVSNPNVPLLFKAGSNGDYTINFNFNTSDFERVILEDRQTKDFIDLTIVSDYRFRASTRDSENRFVLHFGAIKPEVNLELPAKIYSGGTYLIIDLLLVTKETTVTVYDIMGRMLLRGNYMGETQHKIPINTNTQILIVHLENPNGRIAKKIFLKKY